MGVRQRVVPRPYLMKIADEMLTGEPPKRTEYSRPKSKYGILREMVKTDPVIRKKVLDRYDQMLREESLGVIEVSGYKIRTADPGETDRNARIAALEERTTEDGNEPIFWDPWAWLVHYSDPNNNGRCSKCSNPATTWLKDEGRLCTTHAPKCEDCSVRADYGPGHPFYIANPSPAFLCREHHDIRLAELKEEYDARKEAKQ